MVVAVAPGRQQLGPGVAAEVIEVDGLVITFDIAKIVARWLNSINGAHSRVFPPSSFVLTIRPMSFV